jgi:hypothetical protein
VSSIVVGAEDPVMNEGGVSILIELGVKAGKCK